MDVVNEYLKKNAQFQHIPGFGDVQLKYKRIVCNDGFSVSVQAFSAAYCLPREDKAWPYTHVELGYPSSGDELIEEYCEWLTEDPTDNVYGYVPIDIVNKLIEKHGGIKE